MRRISLGFSLLSTALLLAGGCVSNDGPSVFISGHAAPDEDCLLQLDKFKVRGSVNVEWAGAYQLNPVINSQLLNRGSDAPLRADPNGVLLIGAEVELQDAAGSPISFGGLPNPFTVTTSIFVPSTGDPGSPSMTSGSVLAIPPAYMDVLDAMLGDDPANVMVVVIAVELFGETVGGVDVVTAPFSYPIDACQGACLMDCSGMAPVSDAMDCGSYIDGRSGPPLAGVCPTP